MNVIIGNIFLLWGTWQDIKEKKVKNSYLLIGGIVSLIYKVTSLMKGIGAFEGWICALLPGMFLLFVSKITEEKIGYGDGIVILILGNFLRVEEICLVLQGALVLTMIFSIVLLIIKKISKGYEIPFLPFLWISYTLAWGLRYV